MTALRRFMIAAAAMVLLLVQSSAASRRAFAAAFSSSLPLASTQKRPQQTLKAQSSSSSRNLLSTFTIRRASRLQQRAPQSRRHDERLTHRLPTAASTHKSALFSSSASSPSTTEKDASNANDQTKPVPITLLAGFLGSGKTTTLKNLLENTSGLKIGCVVNDVASVNIDAKLIAGSDAAVEAGLPAAATVELQNGCACCSLADELLTSVERLLYSSDGGESGLYGKRRELDAVVVELSGVADPVAVKQNWDQAKMMRHPVTKLADVNRVVTVVDACTFGTDWMTWDTSGERKGWVDQGDDCAAQRRVPELLAEQVEAADLLVINKIDLAGQEQVKVASSVAKGLNDKAGIFEVEYGKINPEDLLEGNTEAASHDHDHDHSCSDPQCDDPSHDHSHSHDHASSTDCIDPDCTDASHDHSHAHDHDCSDPNCDDTSHSHSHDHASSNTSTDRLGIGSFVYKADIPFNSQRLLNVLNRWPVPIKDELDIGQMQKAQENGAQVGDVAEDNPFVGVLRSKGFCWMAPAKWTGGGEDAWRHETAMYWSHAGKHFGITTAGKWWGTLGKEQMKQYFAGNMEEYERILKEDWASEEWGDRRQELVFIGTNLDQDEITNALNDCLLTEEEMDKYRQQLNNFMQSTFTMEAASGPSLFDVEGTDHMDMK